MSCGGNCSCSQPKPKKSCKCGPALKIVGKHKKPKPKDYKVVGKVKVVKINYGATRTLITRKAKLIAKRHQCVQYNKEKTVEIANGYCGSSCVTNKCRCAQAGCLSCNYCTLPVLVLTKKTPKTECCNKKCCKPVPVCKCDCKSKCCC